MIEPAYDILIEDADGLPVLAARYPGTRLILWNHKTRMVLAQTDGY
jgi:hypothetical protein